jgi:ABC-type nitrate/sulfonate/bicarbonate transport system ATPase subunit
MTDVSGQPATSPGTDTPPDPADYSYGYDGVVLKLEHVSLAFPKADGTLFPVLTDVNAVVQNITRPHMAQGQVIGLLGPSGVGKTQLFRLMAGLAVPTAVTSGRVLLGSNETPAALGLMGVVAQKYPLFRHRTVLSNLLVAGTGPTAARQERAQQLLREFALESCAESYPDQLSGGQQQRVAIAQQLMTEKHFLLMDEPFSGLDPVMTERVIRLVQRVTCLDEYNTTIVVTHDIGSAIAVSDTLWVMGRQRTADGTPVPGAQIVRRYDLAAMGLAWRPDIRHSAGYQQLSSELRALFTTL